MDALALLCNLHAEGPRTLQRLRRIGCETIAALEDTSPEVLARELEGDEAAALRFLREARLLAQRLVLSGPTDPELEPELEGDPDPIEAARSEEDGDESAADTLPPAPPREELPERARADVGRVLETWRALDQSEPPEAPRPYVVPRPPEPAGNRALDEVALDGLTPRLVARLAEAGILSLRGLEEAHTVSLARLVDLPFTHLRRLQFLARRATQRFAAEPIPAPVASPDHPSSAGPFA